MAQPRFARHALVDGRAVRGDQKRFQRLVDEAFVSRLKPAGYRKTGNAWHRPGGPVVPVIDIQKSWGDTTDLTRFTSNWGLHVPDVLESAGSRKSLATYAAPFNGRIGWFAEPRRDRWWRVDAGRLARSAVDEQITDEEAQAEVTRLVDVMTTYLDSVTTPSQVADLIEDWAASGKNLAATASANPFNPPDTIERLRSGD